MAHHNYKGDAAKDGAKRLRAVRMYALGTCERCGVAKATDRHHKDGNTGHNERSNIALLCRRCHMIEDGRLERLIKLDRPVRVGPLPCCVCSNLSKPLRRGRCHRCNEYLRRHGEEWTAEKADKRGRRTPDRACITCRRMVGVGWCKGRCPTCRMYLRRYGVERRTNQ